MRLIDMPDADRMTLRARLESTGCQIDGYDGEHFQVSLPNPVPLAAITAAGFTIRDRYCFPLGTDKAPEHMRHDGPYPGCRGYWMHARATPTA